MEKPVIKIKRRQCRICRRWFQPDHRQHKRQKICHNPECKKKWHIKTCAKWNKKNSNYFKGIYVQKKIEAKLKSEKIDLASHIKFEQLFKAFSTQQAIMIVCTICFYIKNFKEA